MTNVRLEVLPDRAAIVERGLSLVLEKARAAIAENGRFTIVLAGGSTPKPLYEAIATQDLPWEKIHVFWGDERYVSPDRPESNQRMAREAWLDRVPIPAANLHPIPTEAGDPATDARTYDRHIDEFFQSLPDPSTAFDLILLGMGDDGHTASLFPHTEALKVSDTRVTVGSKNGEPRITLTVPQLQRSRHVIFLVSGANKYPALSKIFDPETDPAAYPAKFVRPEGELWWLADEPAARDLQEKAP